MTYTTNTPTYGGAREFGRVNKGYRGLGKENRAKRARWYSGLGQVELPTVTGVAYYADGGFSRELVERHASEAAVAAWGALPGYNLQLAGPFYIQLDGVPNTPVWDVYSIEQNVRPGKPGGPDGGPGWYLYMANLIPVPGGALPGYVLLDGQVPTDLVVGNTYTLRGTWAGTPPNNLCGNCGWHFNVSVEAPAEAQGDTGAIAPDSEEMIEIRIEAIEAEDPEAGAEARERYEAGEVTLTEAPAPAATQAPEEEEGEPPSIEAAPPPVLRAGLSSGALAALAAVALLFLPIGKKKKSGGGGGFA